jgi:hypothetical protein
MASFTVHFSSSDTTTTIDCDGYAQEGTMLTFFVFGSACTTIDAWSRRVASYRISDVTSVVRSHEWAAPEVPVLVAC